MIPTISTNEREFGAVLREVLATSERTYPQVVNGQGLALSVRSLRNTEQAGAGKIAQELGQTASTTKVTKRGRVKFGWAFASKDTLAHRIVISRLKKAGKAIPSAAEIDRMAKKMVAARRRASSFIRSGWIYAIRTLSRAVGYRDARGQRHRAGEAARMTGAAKGYAKPAQRVLSGIVECEIANTALIQEDGASRSPRPVAERGLNRAFEESVRDMRRHLSEKLGSVFAKFYGR